MELLTDVLLCFMLACDVDLPLYWPALELAKTRFVCREELQGYDCDRDKTRPRQIDQLRTVWLDAEQTLPRIGVTKEFAWSTFEQVDRELNRCETEIAYWQAVLGLHPRREPEIGPYLNYLEFRKVCFGHLWVVSNDRCFFVYARRCFLQELRLKIGDENFARRVIP